MRRRDRSKQADKPSVDHAKGWDWPKRLMALIVLVNVVGLNAYALRLNQSRSALERQAEQVVRDALPGVTTVIDAKQQMQNALDQARRVAGLPAVDDYAAMLTLVSSIVAGTTSSVRYENRELTVIADRRPPSSLVANCAGRGLLCKVSGRTVTVKAQQ